MARRCRRVATARRGYALTAATVGGSTGERWTSRHRRGLEKKELDDNELGVAAGVDGRQDMEDLTPVRSSGSGKERHQTSDSRMATQRDAVNDEA
ncbi:hypothetical protein Scep_025925 [Stephania cephalantha]|uniref:Uncharacterized protein n=1 Tax=Stephania cephalantha TaxID=152367 RepID=A0AAP0HS08_9MAGN